MAGFFMKHWFSDGALRTIIRNAAYLGSSNVVGALLNLLALSCAGKGMSPAMFGMLVVIQSYAKAISDFIKFQTWQLVVQYGTPALASKNVQKFRDVIAFSFGLDIASGTVAVIGGMLLLPLLSHSLGLDSHHFWLAMLYCTLIPSLAASTPTGILRAVDRFDLIAVQQATKPFLRAAGSVISYLCDFGFTGFIITWYGSNLVGEPFTGGLLRANCAAEISITHYARDFLTRAVKSGGVEFCLDDELCPLYLGCAQLVQYGVSRCCPGAVGGRAI